MTSFVFGATWAATDCLSFTYLSQLPAEAIPSLDHPPAHSRPCHSSCHVAIVRRLPDTTIRRTGMVLLPSHESDLQIITAIGFLLLPWS